MVASMKNKIGLSIILMAIICFVSLPRLTLTASAQPVNSQTAHGTIHSTVKDPDFSIYASPSYLSTTAGLSVNTTILVTPRYNFNGTISLSASVPDGWTATFIPDSLSMINSYYGYYFYGFYNWSTLSLGVPSDAAVGQYMVVVTGTNGTLAHSANVTVNVVSPDFQLNVYPSYLSVTAGSTGNSTVMVSPLYGFDGTVSLSASVPDGWSASFVSSSLSLANGYYGYYYGGSYNWSTLSITVPSDAAAGKYTIVVTGSSGSLAHSVNITVNVVAPDFRIYAYLSYLSATADSTANSTIMVMPLNKFSGIVSLSASVPDGWSATFVSSSLSLTNGYYGYYSYGNYNWSSLSIAVPSDAAAGKYTIVVTGTSGSIVHSVNVTVNVVAPDFRIYAYPSYLSATADSTANSTIILKSLYGFSDTVSLAASVPDGWSASFVSDSLSLTNGYYEYYSYGNYNWSTLSITVPSGTATGKYTVVVTGSSGSLTHSVNITVNVVAPDFRIYVFPSHLSAAADSTVNSTIILTSLYGFNDTVSLSASVPDGWSASFVPSSLAVTTGYFNCSALSVTVPVGTADGKYTIVVTGSSGSLTHSVNVTVNVGGSDFWRMR
jgi:uncharacterized membrane protein